MKVTSYTATGTKSSATVSDELFGAKPNRQLLAQAIRVYLSNLRQGTSKVKTRSEVARTKAKWYRQKGTGNARHGAKTPNIFVGGGVAHGPNGLQNWTRKLPQRMKQVALVSALSAQAEQVIVNDSFEQLSGKTKEAAQLLTQMGLAEKRVLVIAAQPSVKTVQALRNLPQVLLTKAARTTALEVVNADVIVITKPALEALEARVITSNIKAK